MTPVTEGLVAFHVHVRVDVRDMAAWSPARIEAFLRGVAMVQAAARGEVRQMPDDEKDEEKKDDAPDSPEEKKSGREDSNAA